MFTWTTMESGNLLLGVLLAILLSCSLNQLGRIVLVGVMIVFIPKKVLCLYVVPKRAKEIEGALEKMQKLQSASETDSSSGKKLSA